MQRNFYQPNQKGYNFKENAPICLIDLSAIKGNARLIKNKTLAKFCAVVKSDAYGHGLVECANELCNICDCFAVATVKEGVKLRIAGIQNSILCLLPVRDIYRACVYGIVFAVHTYEYAKEVRDFCVSQNITATVHIAVNSGMNRLGVNSLSQFKNILKLTCKNFQIAGVFSHLFKGEDFSLSEKQLAKFYPFMLEAKKFNKNILAHISATSGMFLGEKFHLDMVRVGIAMYGYNAINSHLPLKKAMKVIAPIIQKRNLKSGEYLLYGDYKIKEDSEVGIYAYGYSNGVRKNINAILNNACMNICALKTCAHYVEIMNDALSFAKRENTIEYDILTRFGLTCNREYYYGDKNESYFR